jgi:N6-adenosine-specific RNA methylase IME4
VTSREGAAPLHRGDDAGGHNGEVVFGRRQPYSLPDSLPQPYLPAPPPFEGLPRRACGALHVDLPWRYVTWSETRQNRTASRHYSVWSLERIKALPVRELALPDAWVFLWVPFPHLGLGFDVIRAWGLKFSGNGFLWAKLRKGFTGDLIDIERDFHLGLGHTTRKNTEPCLLAKVGKPKIRSHSVRELIVTRRREHSRKPDEAADRIREFCAGPYLELFARTRRSHWVSWGDQLGRFSTTEDPTP